MLCVPNIYAMKRFENRETALALLQYAMSNIVKQMVKSILKFSLVQQKPETHFNLTSSTAYILLPK